jgi:hypothetical protein
VVNHGALRLLRAFNKLHHVGLEGLPVNTTSCPLLGPPCTFCHKLCLAKTKLRHPFLKLHQACECHTQCTPYNMPPILTRHTEPPCLNWCAELREYLCGTGVCLPSKKLISQWCQLLLQKGKAHVLLLIRWTPPTKGRVPAMHLLAVWSCAVHSFI